MRRAWDGLIFVMWIPILVGPHLYIETGLVFMRKTYSNELTRWDRNKMEDICKVEIIFVNEQYWFLYFKKILEAYFETSINNKSALSQVMVWPRQAKIHGLNQYWSHSMTPCSVTRSQLFKKQNIYLLIKWLTKFADGDYHDEYTVDHRGLDRFPSEACRTDTFALFLMRIIIFTIVVAH